MSKEWDRYCERPTLENLIAVPKEERCFRVHESEDSLNTQTKINVTLVIKSPPVPLSHVSYFWRIGP